MKKLINYMIENMTSIKQLLTRCYTQHDLRPYIDSEMNHIRHFITIQFINKGIDFIDLPSIIQLNRLYLIILKIKNRTLFAINIINLLEDS